jgi:hypothetical protein
VVRRQHNPANGDGGDTVPSPSIAALIGETMSIATQNEPHERPEHAPTLPYGPARTALELAVRRLDYAEQDREPASMSEALAGIARCYRALSAYPTAMDFMHQSLRWSYAIGGVDLRVELLCELAELSCEAAEAAGGEDGERQRRLARDCARDMAFEAARVAAHAADPYWEIKVLLRASDTLDRCGDHDDAITMQTRAMTLMVRHPDVADSIADGQNAAGGHLM